jgi:hypothetical protein
MAMEWTSFLMFVIAMVVRCAVVGAAEAGAAV